MILQQQLKLRVQRCLACSERKAWHCSHSWEFFFGEAVSSQHSGCLAVVLGRSVLIFPLGSTLPLCVSVPGSAAEAAASASPPGQVGKNAPLGDSPPSVTLISCRWLAWDVSAMCHTARGPDEKAGLPGAPGFPTSRGHSEALCHLGNLGPGTRVRCPRTQKQHSSGRQRQKNTGMGTCLGVDVQACSALGQTPPAGRYPISPWAVAWSVAGTESKYEAVIMNCRCSLKVSTIFMSFYLDAKPGSLGLLGRIVMKSFKDPVA